MALPCGLRYFVLVNAYMFIRGYAVPERIKSVEIFLIDWYRRCSYSRCDPTICSTPVVVGIHSGGGARRELRKTRFASLPYPPLVAVTKCEKPRSTSDSQEHIRHSIPTRVSRWVLPRPCCASSLQRKCPPAVAAWEEQSCTFCCCHD